ncbi:MAG TPA: matrixin family metalloprotease, partial [Nitrosopumilaceae archaeon]|nr:matrixin family metalloprotease [Nitrosopumilaceae archaeon]
GDEAKKIESISKKYYLTIALSAIAITAIIIPYSLFTMTLVGQEHRVDDLGNIKSGYVVQNLKGDKIDTWLSWRLSNGAALYVNILNAKQYPEKTEAIKSAILSKEFYEIDDNILGKAPKGTISKYYLGWAGALETASQKGSSQFYIPTNLKVIDSANGAGDITIILENKKNGDGFTGWTKSIADESQNQILKSEITIYDVENLSDNQLLAIARHELGHAFGLAHSSAEEDLMFPTLETPYPYISHCDIDAISNLYDGGKKSEVVCEK